MRAVFCVLEQTDGLCLRAKFRLDRFLLSPSGGENPKFYHFIDFGILWCCQLVAIWESRTQVHNYKPSLIQWHQNRFCTRTPSWRNRAHKLWRSKALRTNKQKTQLFWLPSGGWSPSPTKFGMVIKDLEHVLAPPKQSQLRRIVLPPRGAENLGETRPLNLNKSVTPWANPSKFLQQLTYS